MEVFFVIAFVWAIITLVGHGTWVLIRSIFTSLTPEKTFPSSDSSRSGLSSSPFPPHNSTTAPDLHNGAIQPNPQEDLVGFTRMIDALASDNHLPVDEGEILKQKAQELAATFKSQDTNPQPLSLGLALDLAIEDESEVLDELELIDADSASTSIGTIPSSQPREVATPFHQPTPKQAVSEIVTSFLAQHNIRWGELIAGILIVVCSIGLVLSLWSTLTSAHRIVPAVVFMSADAAIFAAGLYTMKRWKLRHTSRAVLIIATLLVPLCVLAGLAAAGADAESVSLTDPVTLGVIGLATLSCGWLLWHACVALVGRITAAPMIASVVSSSLTLPLLPAASRWLGVSAGWVVIVPALFTAFSFLYRHERCRTHGRRIWKNQWLHLCVAVSSFASVIAYTAFLLQAGGRETWIQIAIATIPVWTAIAMVFGSRAIQIGQETSSLIEKLATRRLIASVIALIAAGLVAAIVPASIEKVSWLWLHAITTGLSIGVFGWSMNRLGWVVAATLPIGIVGTMTSPVWLAGESWSEIPIYRTIFSGEPMIVAIGMLMIGIAATVVLRLRSMDPLSTAKRSFANQALLGWLGIWGTLVVGQAIVLSWTPASWLGLMPTQAVGVVLAVIIGVTGWLVTTQLTAVSQGLLAIVAAVAGVSLTTLIGGQELWQMGSWRNGETVWTLGLVMTLIGVVWMAIELAVRLRSSIEIPSTEDNITSEVLTTAACLFGFTTVWQAASIVVGPLAAELGRLGQWICLPATSLSTTAVHGVGLALLGSTCLVANRFKPNGFYPKLISSVGMVAGLFLSLTVAVNVTVIAEWQLVVMTTLACGTLAAVHWKFPSPLLAWATSGIVATGSLVLLRQSWWLPIKEGGSPDLWICVGMATWWLLGSALLARTNVRWKRTASALVVPLTFAMLTPVFFSVTPIVWFQATAVGALAWLLADRCWDLLSSSDPLEADEAFSFSVAWIRLIGFASVVGLFAGILMRASWAASWSLPIGWLMTVIAMGSLVVGGERTKRVMAVRALEQLPLAIPIMSGHLACLGILAGWLTRGDLWLVVSVCCLIGSIGSAIVIWSKRSVLQSWHVSLQTGLIFVLAVSQGGSFAWIAMAGLVVAAVALMRISDGVHSRGLSWFVVLGGIYLVLFGPPELRDGILGESQTWLMVWTGACVVLWRSDRIFGTDSLDHQRGDIEATALMLPMLGWGILQATYSPQWQWALTAQTTITHHFYQAAIALLTGASGMLGLWGSPQRTKRDLDPNRFGSRALWRSSLWLMIGSVVLTCITVATIFDARSELQWMIASLSSMSIIAVISWTASRHASNAIGLSVERVTMVLVGIGTLIGIGLSLESSFWNPIDEATATWARISILGLGSLAWAVFGLAEQTRPATGGLAVRRRDRSILIALWMVALLAVFGGPTLTEGTLASQTDRSIGMVALVASMRLLIASILAIGLLVLAIPKLLAGPFVERWQSSLKRGGTFAAITAAGALVTMLALEAFLRQRGFGVVGLPMPTVIVVGLMLAVLAIMAGVVAVLSGPGFQFSDKAHWLQLPDRKRIGLLYASQGIGFLTWLHLFLCRTRIAHLGLRPYWPYIVMLLAFVSVGLTQWAIRRGDRVLAETMKRTAMFLPLVPVVGFWLSGSYSTFFHAEDWSWTFYRGATSYQGLLLVGAIYYGIMSFIWKNGFPRVASVVLANVGLWVMLTQTPGWHFLTHPQAWMIPPAVCVLLVTHLQREKLDAQIGSAIRYAATLVIYLSSTADMLLSEIGSSLWGPIVLILISLAGMLAGVALRVKPFLYLGTIFTFLGVVSMVWHAGQAIDAVWPWWVFGITTGLILLTILAGIEKHRDQLQRWSERLATWN